MKVPLHWMTKYVSDLPSLDELALAMTISGTEVEEVERIGIPADGMADGDGTTLLRTGQVVETEQHPNADRLTLCKVDVGADDPQQIICGASNFEQGDKVAVILPGARMPGGDKLGSAKLRGVESHGMMLSERELELSDSHDGIIVLPADTPVGDDLNAVVPVGDDVLKFEVTPNRPDCLGVYGIAREAAAACGGSLAPIGTEDADASSKAGDVQDHVKVHLEAPDACQRYMARAFTDVKVEPSPLWLKQRLSAAGMRPINNVVDVTNYVMLLTGQPLHAFDADKIKGGEIIIRHAQDGEEVTTLDDETRTLQATDLVIADTERTAVIAGVMGAGDVEVDDTTTRVVLEAAAFDGRTILETSHRLNLRSESSARFEKGLDPYSPEIAMRLASLLLVDLLGANMASGTIDEQRSGGIDTPPTITFDLDDPARILGFELSRTEAVSILERLGYGVDAAGNTATIAVPTWRMYDTTRPIDLVEEVGRIAGLERVPSTLPARRDAIGGLTPRQQMVRRLEDSLATMGFQETITYTLAAAGTADQFGVPASRVVNISNPMTRDHAELRTTPLVGLLKVAASNNAAGTGHTLWFERARTFFESDDASNGTSTTEGTARFADEHEVITMLAGGAPWGARVGTAGRGASVAELRGIIDNLIGSQGLTWSIEPFTADDAPPYLHPGASGRIVIDGAYAGWVGDLHPTTASDAGLGGTWAAAEIRVGELAAALPGVLTVDVPSSFPASTQDIAIIIDESTAAGSIMAAIEAADVTDLESASIFDRYDGDQVPDGKYSLAIRLTFRASDRTLEDGDVDAGREAVVDLLGSTFSASLRDE